MEEIKMIESVLEEKIKGLKEIVEKRFDYNDTQHSDMLTQVKNTNGRVKRLELWRSALIGGWTILTICILPIIFIVVKNLIE